MKYILSVTVSALLLCYAAAKPAADTLTCSVDVGSACSSSVKVLKNCQYYCPCKGGVLTAATKCVLNRFYDSVDDECKQDQSVCQLEPTVPTPEEPCSKEGEKTANPHQCKKYYICTGGKLKPESCGSFHYFDVKSGDCKFSMFGCKN